MKVKVVREKHVIEMDGHPGLEIPITIQVQYVIYDDGETAQYFIYETMDYPECVNTLPC